MRTIHAETEQNGFKKTSFFHPTPLDNANKMVYIVY